MNSYAVPYEAYVWHRHAKLQFLCSLPTLKNELLEAVESVLHYLKKGMISNCVGSQGLIQWRVDVESL